MLFIGNRDISRTSRPEYFMRSNEELVEGIVNTNSHKFDTIVIFLNVYYWFRRSLLVRIAVIRCLNCRAQRF